jgi:hypothetical protein
MLTKYNFELELEKIAEKFYSHGTSDHGMDRSGNAKGNEDYFRTVVEKIKDGLKCQQLKLKKQKCPDSGIFGDFNYKHSEDVDWESIKAGKSVAFSVTISSDEQRFIEIRADDLLSSSLFIKEQVLDLNSVGLHGEFFGVEYKAKKNKSTKAIGVASFNSTCPSSTKTTLLKNIKLFHNLEQLSKKKDSTRKDVFFDLIKVQISFSMYYLIVNDEKIGKKTKITYIFLCHGSFFAPNLLEQISVVLSKQKTAKDMKMEFDLERVKLRYRPFFEARSIKAVGYGLYTSWKPKLPELLREGRERDSLLAEVLAIQQSFKSEEKDPLKEHDNVIYLNLTGERIRKRAA